MALSCIDQKICTASLASSSRQSERCLLGSTCWFSDTFLPLYTLRPRRWFQDQVRAHVLPSSSSCIYAVDGGCSKENRDACRLSRVPTCQSVRPSRDAYGIVFDLPAPDILSGIMVGS